MFKVENTVQNTAVFFLLIFFLAFSTKALSQETGKLLYKASFVKPEIIQKSGELSFNVIKIVNHSDTAIRILPVLNFPKDWAMFSTSFSDTIIQPHSEISLPFRFRTSPTAKSNIEHEIQFKAIIAKKNILIESKFVVQLEAFHSWNVIIPVSRVFFYPRIDIARFEIIVVNSGNTTELISLELKPDSKITLEGLDISGFRQEIYLEPNSDTTLTFKVKYTYSEDRVFDISKVQIHASANDKKIFRAVILEKYSDAYAPFDINRNLNHETEVGIRNFSKNDEILPFFKARGNAAFKNESTFKYNFTYYDLTETEDFISNSYYNFLYTWNDLNIGLGAFSSELGRNLYSRNSLMVSNIIKISSTSNIKGFASYSLISPKSSAAVGYSFSNNKVDMIGSISYDVDGVQKTNTASVALNSGRIAINKNNDISLIMYGYHEDHYLYSKYQQYGFAWDLNYFSKIGKNLTFHFTNNYGSPNIPGPQMGLLNFHTKLKYSFTDSKNYITTKYVNSSRDYYYIDPQGTKLPDIILRDQYINVFFHSNSNKKLRWYVGPSVEFYRSSTPVPNQDERIEYNILKYRIEYKSFLGRHFMLSLKYGIGESVYQEFEEISDIQHDFHILTDYHNNGYGIRFSYDFGPMVNTGLYQHALDAGNNSINISPYVMKKYFKDRMSLTMFTNYTYRFDLEYGSLNINPKVETYVFKNWYAVVGGTYNFTHQTYEEYDSQNSFYYLEFSIKKRWGKSDYNKWQKDLRRLKIKLFKDANSDGIMDKNEEGVSNTKVRIQITNMAKQTARNNFPVDITLMTNDKGIVTFNRIPMGFYKVTIIPLSDLQEYFYVDNSSEHVEVNKNSELIIPFQKASKITGTINLKRQKFKDTEKRVDLANIKVTAYNNKGNSYSTFTTKDGKFVIFAPGNHAYTLRIKNVFGNNYRILKNDIRILLTDTTNTPMLFEVVEQNRKIKFKKATQASKDSDSPKLQKIKVLPGKIYDNSENKTVDKNAIPEFNTPDIPIEIHSIISGKYYIVAGHFKEFENAKKLMHILYEQGLKSYIGTIGDPETYYVYIQYFDSRFDALQKLNSLKKMEIKPITIIKF